MTRDLASDLARAALRPVLPARRNRLAGGALVR